MSKTSEKPKERPAAEVREGSVKIAIWQHQNEKGAFFTAGQPQLSYRDDDGNWHESHSYSEFDMVDLIVAAAKAKSEIRKLRRAANPKAANEAENAPDPSP